MKPGTRRAHRRCQQSSRDRIIVTERQRDDVIEQGVSLRGQMLPLQSLCNVLQRFERYVEGKRHSVSKTISAALT
jgi:hypothetical protein